MRRRDMHSPRGGKLAAVCAGMALALLAFASPAAGDEVICETGEGPGQCSSPTAAAVDRAEGILYVADSGNQEVDAYEVEDGDPIPASSFEVGVSLSGIAVDNFSASTPPRGDVYVFDTTNNRVRRYHPDGEHVLDIGEGAFASQPKLAVGPGGIIYVADNIGGGDRRVQKFDHEGNPVETCSPLTPGEFGGNLRAFAVDSEGGFYLANGGNRAIERYDSSCTWLEEPFHNSFNIRALAVDGEDNLFVGDSTGTGETAIYAYDPTNTLFKVLYGDGTPKGLTTRPSSLAPLSAAGEDLFAVEGQGERRVVRVSYPPPGPIVHPDPDLSEADPIGNTWATLNALINPEGKATEYRFQYVDDATYQAEGFASPRETPLEALVPPAEPNPEVLPLYALSEASATIGCLDPEDPPQASCLEPETLYHFRAVAINEDSEPEERLGPEATFETKESFEILATFSTEVGFDAARINAQVNPLNIPATGYFEYVDQATFEASGFAEATQVPDVEGGTDPIEFGAGEEPVIRSAQLHGLQPNTTYRYRVVVANFFEQEEGELHAFTTFALPAAPPACPNDPFRIGAASALPDCRAYEMVSPVGKGGGEVLFPTDPESAIGGLQGADRVPAQGRGLAYTSKTAFGDAVSAPAISQYLASRHSGGWRTHGISPPREGPSFLGPDGVSEQYKALSADLRWGWLRSDTEPPLDEDALPGYANLHRRDNPADDYRSICPPAETPAVGPLKYELDLQGFSQDGALAAFRATEGLTEDAAPGQAFQLYACRVDAGEAALMSVLPGGGANPGGSTLGTPERLVGVAADSNLHNAFSEDGERAYWTDLGFGSAGPTRAGRGKIYLRERPFGGQSALVNGSARGEGKLTKGSSAVSGVVTSTGAFAAGQRIAGDGITPGTTIVSVAPTTLTLSAPAEINTPQDLEVPGEEKTALEAFSPCAEPAKACTIPVSQAVEEPGGWQQARFWTASPDGSTAIFQFTTGALSGNLYEFDADAGTPALIATGVSGLAGWSEDASRLYLVSDADLDAGGPAEGGTDNLYLHQAGAAIPLRLVAALEGGADVGGYCGARERLPRNRCTRATPDGSALAFVSQDPLTGYDNADAASGEPDAEVFLYDAAASEGAGELVCVSCNPSGARPAGRSVDTPGEPPTWIAAKIPGWNGFQAPRVISADGQRLFFESFDALVPADTNGAQDVYEWQRAGKGSCEAGDPNHFEANGGCLDLISSGRSPKDSHFADASADGSDVFFSTSESLVPQDPGLADFYDARVGGGFPPPPPPEPECEGEACQSPPPAPEAPAPGSQAFRGAGNLPAPRPSCKTPARRAKRLSRKAKRARRAARRVARRSAPRKARGMRRRAARNAKRAKRMSRKARQCRRRARGAQR